MSPTTVVQAQLDAYNARDIDAFAATFAETCVGIDLDTGATRFDGHAGLRERYGKQFRDQPRQRSTVVSRNVVGEYVFDLEYITGGTTPSGEAVPPFHMMAIYRVRGGVIDACWFTPRA
jgi:hypothetical protein